MNLMIRPFAQNNFPELTENPATVFSSIILVSAALLAAFFISRYAAALYKGNKKTAAFFFIGITAVVIVLLFAFFGCAATTVKGIIFCLILTYASYEDIRTRECDEYIHLMIVIAAFIGTSITSFPFMFMSALLVGSVIFITTVITKTQIGGADIKLSAACAFMLGTARGFTGLTVGLIIAVIINTIKNKENKKAGFPLIPYLAAGFATAYFI